MAKPKKSEGGTFKKKAKVRRPGRHSKKRSSSLKSSKNYVKSYKGQG